MALTSKDTLQAGSSSGITLLLEESVGDSEELSSPSADVVSLQTTVSECQEWLFKLKP